MPSINLKKVLSVYSRLAVLLAGVCIASNALAFSSGISDRYTNNTATNCASSGCHSGGSYNYQGELLFDSEVDDANVLSPGATYAFTYSMSTSGVSAPAAGFNLHVDSGTLEDPDANTELGSSNDQVTHTARNTSGDPFQWSFDWVSPSTAGIVDVEYCGLPVNNAGDFNAGDGNVTCGVTTITLSEPPSASNDTANVDEDSTNNIIGVLSNDDAGGPGDSRQVIGLCSTSTPDNNCNSSSYNGSTGVVVLNGTSINNSVSFDPDPAQSSSFSFKYKMENGAGQTDTATVTVSVNAANPTVMAVDDAAQVEQNSSATTINVLANDLPLTGLKTITGVCATATGTAACRGNSYETTLGTIQRDNNRPGNQLVFLPAKNRTGNFEVKYVMQHLGGSSAATLLIKVVETAIDEPPVIVSRPVTSATEGVRYTYNVNATDAEGETLVYRLARAPAGAKIKSNNGIISWVPRSSVSPTENFRVAVSELGTNGQTTTQSFVVQVRTINDQPVITSEAPSSGTENMPYSYQLAVSDPDDSTDELTFGLSNEPQGMTISNTGLVEWLPGNDDAGEYTFKVFAQDGGENDTRPAVEVVTLIIADVPDPSAGDDEICFPVVASNRAVTVICL